LHEFSLVQGIISSVLETAEKKKARVLSFEVRVGELAQFDIRLVRDLLDQLKEGTPLGGSRVVVKQENSKVRCLSCGSVWGFKEIVRPMSKDEKEVVHYFPELLSSYTKCPSCSKSYFEIEEGRSVRIVELTLDD